MKKLIVTPDVEFALTTLRAEEARQVRAWFDHLANWDDDAFVRVNSHALPDVAGVNMLRTSSDYRIFFSLEGDTITVLDVATKQAILRTAGL